MDNFNDFYNRFIASQYGVNVLNYLFFITAFFSIILYAVLGILITYQNKNGDVNSEFTSTTGYSKPTTN